jgi:3-dehydroquinate dehydratase-2
MTPAISVDCAPFMRRILVVHGPNLNLLGTRQPEIYGNVGLTEINAAIEHAAQKKNAEVRTYQSNSEGAIVDALHDARGWADGIIINAGAYTHYSYAIADALAALNLPAVEVHLSNIFARDEWRRRSVLGPVVVGSICGFGWRGYVFAVEAILDVLEERSRSNTDSVS